MTKEDSPVIDAHVHMFGDDLPRGRLREGIAARLDVIGIKGFRGQAEFIASMMDRSGVDKALVYANPAEGVADMLKGYGDRFVLFARADMRDGKKAAEELSYCVNSLGFRGLGELMPSAMHFYADDFASLDPLYRRAADLGTPISWDFKVGARTAILGNYKSTFPGVSRLQEVCGKYPQLNHIVCHIGGLDSYSQTLTALSDYQQVYFDLSETSSSLFWRHMTPRWASSSSSSPVPWPQLQLFSYLYPEMSPSPPKDREEVVARVKADAVRILREAGNVVPGRILMGSDSPLVGRVDLELQILREAFGHDKTLLDHVLGLTAKKLLLGA